MADCKRCGRKLPFYSFSEICSECKAAMARYAREQGLLPVAEKNGRLVVAVDDPMLDPLPIRRAQRTSASPASVPK